MYDFDSHVSELTALAERSPRRYRRGVLAWTLLGYAALACFLIAGVLGVVAAVAGGAALVGQGGLVALE